MADEGAGADEAPSVEEQQRSVVASVRNLCTAASTGVLPSAVFEQQVAFQLQRLLSFPDAANDVEAQLHDVLTATRAKLAPTNNQTQENPGASSDSDDVSALLRGMSISTSSSSAAPATTPATGDPRTAAAAVSEKGKGEERPHATSKGAGGGRVAVPASGTAGTAGTGATNAHTSNKEPVRSTVSGQSKPESRTSDAAVVIHEAEHEKEEEEEGAGDADALGELTTALASVSIYDSRKEVPASTASHKLSSTKPLRLYQRSLVTKVQRHHTAGNKSVLVYLPTGGGKTRVAMELMFLEHIRVRLAAASAHRWLQLCVMCLGLTSLLTQRHRSLFVVNRAALVQQVGRLLLLLVAAHLTPLVGVVDGDLLLMMIYLQTVSVLEDMGFNSDCVSVIAGGHSGLSVLPPCCSPSRQ